MGTGRCIKIYAMTSARNAVTLYDTKASQFRDIRVEKIATGFQFTEGPVWHPTGFLLFSDTPANVIWQLYPDGRVKYYMDNSGLIGNDTSLLSDMVGSNGLALDAYNNLVICQHGNHALAMLDRNGVISVLTSSFEGRPYNSPNDLVIRSDRSIYFTDPPYGLKEQVLRPEAFQPHAGVYCYKNGTVNLISDRLKYPNGTCFSPDESFLYISSNHPDEAQLWRYHISVTGEIKEQTIIAEQNADGIKTDHRGNLYLSTDDGILILSSQGQKLALISLPESPTNITWIKPEHTHLYITARSSIYLATGF
jgi:gluconolactonase